MKRQNHLASRLLPAVALLALAGCGIALESEGSLDGARPDLPDLTPDVPGYMPDEDGIERLRAAPGVLRQSKLRGTADGGNADGVHGCAGGPLEYDHYEHGGETGDTQLHVVSVWSSLESSMGSGDPLPRGPVDVTVDRPGNSVLVLSAYSPTQWNVHVAGGATIERVIVSGWHEQSVTAPRGVQVARYSYVEDGAYLGYFGTTWPGYDATELVDAAEILTGLELTSFRGCTASASFAIEAPGALRPPHPESASTKPGIIAGCEAVTAESTYCMVTTRWGERYTMVGLDSGRTCGDLPAEIDRNTTFVEASLAWLGDYLYMCLNDRGLARVSIVDGSVDIAPIYCTGVTSHEGDLLTILGPGRDAATGAPYYLARFASFERAVTREAEEVYEMAPSASRVTAYGNHVYLSGYATSTFEIAEIADGAELRTVTLEGYDDWIDGMDVTPDGRLVIGGGPRTTGDLHVFNPRTGAFQGLLGSEFAHASAGIAGIDCVSGGTAR